MDVEKTNVVVIDGSDDDRQNLLSLLGKFDFVKVIGETNNLKEALSLVDDLEPHLLFLGVRADDSTAFKFLEKLKKQPTIVFLTDNAEQIETFKVAGLRYLRKPFKLSDVQELLSDIQQKHQQLASKMQGLLGKLKFEE